MPDAGPRAAAAHASFAIRWELAITSRLRTSLRILYMMPLELDALFICGALHCLHCSAGRRNRMNTLNLVILIRMLFILGMISPMLTASRGP